MPLVGDETLFKDNHYYGNHDYHNDIPTIERIRKASMPLIIYGRRKTGKTFLAKQVFKTAYYFFVRRDRSIFFENEDRIVSYNELLYMLRNERKKILIVDEFHRLPKDFLDYLHMKSPRNLVLITSTLWLAKNLLSYSSPILGLFSEFKLDIIDERDILLNLKDRIRNKKELVENAVYLREPILLRF